MSTATIAPTADRRIFKDAPNRPVDLVALLRNKIAILDALQATGIARVVVSFEELPFGTYIDKTEVFGSAGRCALPAAQLSYAYPDRKGRFRYMQTSLRDALYGVLNAMLGDACVTSLLDGGTFRIEVADRSFIVFGRGGDRQFQRVY